VSSQFEFLTNCFMLFVYGERPLPPFDHYYMHTCRRLASLAHIFRVCDQS